MGNCSRAELPRTRSRSRPSSAVKKQHAAGDITPTLSSMIEVTSIDDMATSSRTLTEYWLSNKTEEVGGRYTTNVMSVFVNFSKMIIGVDLDDRIRCIDVHSDDTVGDIRKNINMTCHDMIPPHALDDFIILISGEEYPDTTYLSDTSIGMEDEIFVASSDRDIAKNYLCYEKIDIQVQAAAYAAVQVMRSVRSLDLLESLITLHGIDHINQMVLDTAGVSLLILAVTKNNIAALELLVTKYDINPNACCRYGLTAMSYAAQQCDIQSMKVLIKYGGSIKGTVKKSTPLMYAASANHIEIVKFILEVDPSTAHDTNECGDTPLAFSARRRCLAISRMILKAGANPNYANIRGNTPLICAAHAGDLGVVRLLVSHGASPTFANKKDQTSISIAEAVGNTDIVSFLKNIGESEDLCEMP